MGFFEGPYGFFHKYNIIHHGGIIKMSEKKLIGSLIIGQSGGPSSVINCSAYGVIKAGLESDCVTKVYGAFHGIKGVLNDQLMIMD